MNKEIISTNEEDKPLIWISEKAINLYKDNKKLQEEVKRLERNKKELEKKNEQLENQLKEVKELCSNFIGSNHKDLEEYFNTCDEDYYD